MKEKPIEQLNEIRDLMERSSRFISLSGLSGIMAGTIALLGAIIAFFYLDYNLRYFDPNTYFSELKPIIYSKTILILLADAFLVLVLALFSGIYFTSRKARRLGHKIWTHSTRQLLVNLSIPLISGGIFCLILLKYNLIFLVAPVTLLFYGLALINASKYTLGEIRWLGISESILGLIAAFFAGYGLIFWAIGFGVLHIVYGIAMYYKHER